MADIALIGEAYGEVEEREGRPFVGPTGWLLNNLLADAGINRRDCFLTNVFNLRPQNNKIETLCGPKANAVPDWPALGKAGYVQRQYRGELERLADELVEVNPNIIVALGNTAAWALLGKTMITKIRGTVQMSDSNLLVDGFKVLPTYHPAAVSRQWSLRATVIMDLLKAKRESHYSGIRLPERRVWIEPQMEDLYAFERLHIQGCERLAVDIETSGSFVTCIGFAPAKDVAIVIPGPSFVTPRGPYWPTDAIRYQVHEFIKGILEGPIRKTFQNGLYDIAFIYRAMNKITVRNAEHDTMLLHHALQPEALKGLGYLGSIYTDEGAWKQMREHKTTIKRDD